MRTRKIIFHRKCEHGLYKLYQVSSALSNQVPFEPLLSIALFTSTSDKQCNWYNKLRHTYDIILNKLAKCTDFNCIIDNASSKCLMCPLAKAHKLLFVASVLKPVKPFCFNVWWSLDLFYSLNHNCQILIGTCWWFFKVYVSIFFSTKNQTQIAMYMFKAMVEIKFECSIKMVQSDGKGWV